MGKRGFAALAAILLFMAMSQGAYSASCTDWVAKVDSFHGKVESRLSGSTEWRPAVAKSLLCAGDMLRVMEKSRAVIVLRNDTIMRLGQNTTVTMSAQSKEKPSLLDILKGAAYFISRTPQKFKINTPFLNAGVEGTEFLVSVRDTDAMVSVFEGIVVAENSAGSIRLTQGQTASAKAGSAPVLSMTIKPKDAVQWTLYYPLVSISKSSESLPARISSMLASGAATEAEAELLKVLNAEPDNADALSFMSIIAIAQNEKSRAVEYAEKAVASAPNSGIAHIALSYALQAGFDLNGALKSVRTAVQLEPDNALAWARLSELYMSSGEKNESLKAAEKAAVLAPELSRTQTVSGFTHLAQINTDAAMAALEKAASLDPADPLPRLGLGLAKIRNGHLEEGRREIEIAVSLDTGNALIRSYLGKAYHEEKREGVAADQFNMAREADPKDPTAFFYSALQKQAQNRPVEALQDLEKSMELNDNRAVYRSRLMLDKDQAARGASLAKIYDALGFQQLALSEGYKSVNADPANASAHRFLSDSYAALSRHEIARVSELLQAQLLQPVGLNPVQPHLAEPGLFILQGAGPADAGFNEYTQLFDRNRISLLMSGVAGSHSTYGDEIVVSGLHEKVAFSVGQFHYETEGFRKNNDLRTDIYNAFAQVALSDKTSVQAELRSTKKTYGDLALRFYPDNFSTTERNRDEVASGRIGFHHSFAADSDIIGTIGYNHTDDNWHEEFMPDISSLDMNLPHDHGFGGELQYLLKKESLSITSGAGYFNIDRRLTMDIDFVFPPISIRNVTETRISHKNFYLYSQLNKIKNVSVTVGASIDLFNGGDFNKDQFNPKIGLIWTPFHDTTIRTAVFRTLERTLTTGQTLEPTQVAGFNQFYDDSSGTDAWNYGIGIERKLSGNIYGGIEYSYRQLGLPVTVMSSSGNPEVMVFDWRENIGRAYLYWTPHKWFAMSAEYFYEQFDRDRKSFPEVEHLSSHRLPIGINFSHPSGYSIAVKTAYVKQEGDFSALSSSNVISDTSSFWVFDASLGYRLPKRLGMVTIVGKNLFDKSFKYQDMDPTGPLLQPARSVFIKLALTI